MLGMGFLRLLRRGIKMLGEDLLKKRLRIVRKGKRLRRGLEMGWGVEEDEKKMKGRCVGKEGNREGKGMD